MELALVSCSFCPFYRPWHTGPQCLGLARAQWCWGQHRGSQEAEGLFCVGDYTALEIVIVTSTYLES